MELKKEQQDVYFMVLEYGRLRHLEGRGWADAKDSADKLKKELFDRLDNLFGKGTK